LTDVVHHDSELIGWRSVAPSHDEVADFCTYIGFERCSEPVIDAHDAGRNAEPQARRLSGGSLGVGDGLESTAARTGITQLTLALLRSALCLTNVGAGTYAGVDEAEIDEPACGGRDVGEALRLDVDGAVPVEAEPFEVAKGRIRHTGNDPRSVEVFDPHDHAAASRSRLPPGEEKRAGMAQVKEPRWAGRKSPDGPR
jgi:hypothetical protein